MKLLLTRIQKDPDVTIGALLTDAGQRLAWTLEDTVRPDGIKVFGETAIPAGHYVVDITYSPRFKRLLPLLLNVQGFVGIRIHPGNTAGDVEGCIVVGTDRFEKTLGRSRLAFDALFAKLAAANHAREQILLEIAN